VSGGGATAAGSGLVIEELTVRYGDAVAVREVSLEVRSGEIVALLGANGAGKSSLLNAISGLVPSTSRTLSVEGVDLRSLPVEERARWLSHVPEGRRLFAEHSVVENLQLGAFAATKTEAAARLEQTVAVLPQLEHLGPRVAGGLSGGQQQMVALGRGLMADASVLAIDELSLGLAPTVASSFADALADLRDEGHAVLLVEQYIGLALKVADRVVVLERGRVVLEGPVDEVRTQLLQLQAAYLGRGEDPHLEASGDESRAVMAGAPAPKDRGRPAALLTLVGAGLLTASTFGPWFEAVDFGVGTTRLRGWDVPPVYPVVAVVLAWIAAAITSSSVRRTLPSWLLAVGAGTGLGALLTVAARTWLLEVGLAGTLSTTYERQWGLLLALMGAVLVAIGSGRTFKERWRRTR